MLPLATSTPTSPPPSSLLPHLFLHHPQRLSSLHLCGYALSPTRCYMPCREIGLTTCCTKLKVGPKGPSSLSRARSLSSIFFFFFQPLAHPCSPTLCFSVGSLSAYGCESTLEFAEHSRTRREVLSYFSHSSRFLFIPRQRCALVAATRRFNENRVCQSSHGTETRSEHHSTESGWEPGGGDAKAEETRETSRTGGKGLRYTRDDRVLRLSFVFFLSR